MTTALSYAVDRRADDRMGKLFSCGLCALVVGAPMSASAAPSCEPARASATQPPIPVLWQKALDDLVRAASGTHKPWDCSGAELELAVDDRGADLRVRLPDGRQASRPVSAPDLVVPVGEALLARPEERPSAHDAADRSRDARPPATPGARSDIANSSASKAKRGPRLLIDAAAVGRVGAAVSAAWAGGSLRVTVPFGDWSAAAWARADLPVKVLDKVPDKVPEHFTMSEVCLGLAFGYRLLAKPVELRVSGDASFGVIRMSDGIEHLPPAEASEGSRADFRTGADLALAVPFARLGRFIAAGDFEVTPARLPGRRTIRPELPEVPGFSAGLSLGVGVAIP